MCSTAQLLHLSEPTVQRSKSKSSANVERRFVIFRDYTCYTLEFFHQCFERASVFNFDDAQSLEGALTNLLSIVLFRIVVWRRAHGLECCVQRAQQTHTREGKKASNAVLFPPYPREVKTNTTKFKSAAILALACLYGNGATHSHAPASARAWLKHAHSFDGS